MLIFELIIIGIFVGAMSGFFGIGGGMILIPLLLFIGFNIKAAIGISVVQMLFSSIYGSYLNYKKGNLEVNEGIWVGIGGIIGGIIGAHFTDILPKYILNYIFFALVVFAFIRVITAKKHNPNNKEGKLNPIILFFIGLFIGTVALMLGVGGSVLLTPILIGFLHFPSKKASTAGLFFVVFSSVSGTLYKLFAGTFDNLHLDAITVLTVAIAAMVGSFIGVKLKDYVHDHHHKQLLALFYFIILIMLIDKFFIKG